MDEIEGWYHDKRYSQITDRHPDPKVFPDFYKTKRMEFILRPGEMIFIPAGMFHFVFSEDPDPETGLCAAINFWYEHSHGRGNDEGDPTEKPMFGWHDLHLNFDEFLTIIKQQQLKVNTSSFGCFPPDFMKHRRWGGYMSQYVMSFDEFYEAKNPEHYIAQVKFKEFDKFAIPYKNSLRDSSIWINWGNCHTLPHYDGMDNWLCQLKGTRRVILIPQSDRDLMYVMNPYPLKLLKKLFDMRPKESECKNMGDFMHRENGTLQPDIREQLLESIGDCNECIVGCETLEHSYERELRTAAPHPPSHAKWRTFKIKKYFENEKIPNENPMGILWLLTEGQIQLEENVIDIIAGDTISFSSKMLVKVLTDCIIITPHGSGDGT